MNFFNKLPTITYDNNLAVNILARAKLSDSTKANSRLFLPYALGGDERIDTLSNQYYGSPGYTWLVWFANETVDPYYGLPLNEYDLEQYIISKYGSVAAAQRKIKHYKNNWADDDRRISVAAFNNLSNGTQKYWQPVLDYNLNVAQYARRADDQILNTNRIGTISIANSTGSFIIGEEVQDSLDSTTYGFVTYADSTTITVQHLQGTFDTDATLFGKESGSTATVTEANNFVTTTSAFDESYYWSAVTFYDYEVELNEIKKNIVLLDAAQSAQAEQELKRVMSSV